MKDDELSCEPIRAKGYRHWLPAVCWSAFFIVFAAGLVHLIAISAGAHSAGNADCSDIPLTMQPLIGVFMAGGSLLVLQQLLDAIASIVSPWVMLTDKALLIKREFPCKTYRALPLEAITQARIADKSRLAVKMGYGTLVVVDAEKKFQVFPWLKECEAFHQSLSAALAAVPGRTQTAEEDEAEIFAKQWVGSRKRRRRRILLIFVLIQVLNIAGCLIFFNYHRHTPGEVHQNEPCQGSCRQH